MLEYSKRSINTISFIISIIILIMINCFNLFFRNFDFKSTPIIKNFGTNIIEVKFESNTVSQRTKEENIEGNVKYITKGDNNKHEDKEKVSYSQIEGKYLLKISGFGTVIHILQNRITIIILIIILILNCLYGYNLKRKKEIRKEKRRNKNVKS